MNKRFWKWVSNKIQTAELEQSEGMQYDLGIKSAHAIGMIPNRLSRDSSREPPDPMDGKNIQFNMFFAEGGCVLQRRSYNEKTDRSENRLYLISDEKDVAMEVGQIIAMEMMRS